MSRFLRTRDGSSIDLLGAAALVLVAVTILFAAFVVAPVVSLYQHPPTLSAARRNAADSVRVFQASTEHQTELVDGRSWFFEPRRPDDKPAPTTIARVYSGPSLLAYINGTAYFADGQKISIAEPKSKSLKLVRADPPWTITVQWEGGEFSVDLWKRTNILSLKDGSGFSSTFPASAPPAIPAALSGVAPSDRSDLPPDARRGPGADPPAAGSAPPLASDPNPGAPAPAASPSPSPAPSSPPSVPPPAPADPRPEPAPQAESSHPSKP